MREAGLDLVLLWHMHQPDYRDCASGEFRRPWVYLHALKDYTDMAAHLERHPDVRAVINFVPVLLEQIDDYIDQFDTGHFRDPFLRWLAQEDLSDLDLNARRQLVTDCFPVNHTHLVAPFAPFERLFELYQVVAAQGDSGLSYLSANYFADLLTWYHLAWTGETERRNRPLLSELMSRGQGFTADDRARLVDLIGEIVRGLLPRYRALADRGQIELSCTAHTHPIAPLLLDFASAREAMPKVVLPRAQTYPGGHLRVQAQLEHAKTVHTNHFGRSPTGLWPAEGALSDAFLKLLPAGGYGWSASSESVLANSLRAGEQGVPPRSEYLYRPYRTEAAPEIALFFRDEHLSDLIGFEYASWHGRDASAHFLAQLAAVRDQAGADETALVSVILDGENAWECYPYNGYYFLDALYALIEEQDWLRTTTFSDCLSSSRQRTGRLPRLVAGSWVYGTFSTWIGAAEKNRAWDLLCAAKKAFDTVVGTAGLDPRVIMAAQAQLAVCESSDWFWWLGEDDSRAGVQSFDELYRNNLAELYRLLDLPVPLSLLKPLAQGGATEGDAGSMKRAH